MSRRPRACLGGQPAPLLARALGLAAAACEHDWQRYDPRLTPAAGGAGGGTGGQASDGGGGTGAAAGASTAAQGGSGGVAPFCGDGTIDPGEECDDENAVSADGCDDCMVPCAGLDEFEDPLTHACYWHAPLLDWFAAVDECAAWSGFLATVTTQPELDLLREHVMEQSWLGGNEIETRDTWVWENGEPWGFEAWNVGEPNDSGGANDEDCLELYDNPADQAPFGFADDDCTHVQRAVCERPAPHG
jgi:cysteine-rich repeat protein